MNPFLQFLAPTILIMVVRVIVWRGAKQVQAELHTLRDDLDRLASEIRLRS